MTEITAALAVETVARGSPGGRVRYCRGGAARRRPGRFPRRVLDARRLPGPRCGGGRRRGDTRRSGRTRGPARGLGRRGLRPWRLRGAGGVEEFGGERGWRGVGRHRVVSPASGGGATPFCSGC